MQFNSEFNMVFNNSQLQGVFEILIFIFILKRIQYTIIFQYSKIIRHSKILERLKIIQRLKMIERLIIIEHLKIAQGLKTNLYIFNFRPTILLVDGYNRFI